MEIKRPTICEILTHYGSDKNTLHAYGAAYEQLLEPRRDDPHPILEIGVCGGGSVRAWSVLFPNATVHAIDINPATMITGEPRIVTHLCSQTDSRSLWQLAKDHGPFQLIVDDGSHRLVDMLSAFNTLRDFLTPDGLYIIEDIQDELWLENFRMPGFEIFDTRNVKGRYDDMMAVWRNQLSHSHA